MAKASHPTPRGGLFAKIDLRWTDLRGHAAAGRKRRRSSGGYPGRERELDSGTT